MKTPFKLRSGNNIGGRNGKGVNFKGMAASPVRQIKLSGAVTDFVGSFTNFLFGKGKQSDIAGKIGGEDMTNREIGEIKRKRRHSQSFKERMDADKKLREFYKNREEPKVDEPLPKEEESKVETKKDGSKVEKTKQWGYHTKKHAKKLYSFYTAPISETEKGEFPSVSERAGTYEEFGGKDKYRGSSKQNIWLLKQLQQKLEEDIL